MNAKFTGFVLGVTVALGGCSGQTQDDAERAAALAAEDAEKNLEVAGELVREGAEDAAGAISEGAADLARDLDEAERPVPEDAPILDSGESDTVD